MYCACHSVLSTRSAARHLSDEVVEWVCAPSRDEASDVAYAVNRLLGSLLKRDYVSALPATRHVAKINNRMADYGCIRSRRHRKVHHER